MFSLGCAALQVLSGTKAGQSPLPTISSLWARSAALRGALRNRFVVDSFHGLPLSPYAPASLKIAAMSFSLVPARIALYASATSGAVFGSS
jgi:hypothetical protein